MKLLKPSDYEIITPPTAPAPSHLPPSMISSVNLLPTNKRLILFTRHSLRERSDGNGFASYQLPLTPKGRVLAKSWGRWLATHLPYCMDVESISSPIGRCLDTAELQRTMRSVELPHAGGQWSNLRGTGAGLGVMERDPQTHCVDVGKD